MHFKYPFRFCGFYTPPNTILQAIEPSVIRIICIGAEGYVLAFILMFFHSAVHNSRQEGEVMRRKKLCVTCHLLCLFSQTVGNSLFTQTLPWERVCVCLCGFTNCSVEQNRATILWLLFYIRFLLHKDFYSAQNQVTVSSLRSAYPVGRMDCRQQDTQLFNCPSWFLLLKIKH